PTAERIRILRGMTGASFAAYEEAYRSATGRSVIDAQSLQTDTPATIRGASDASPIESRRNVRDMTYRVHGYVPVTCNCGAVITVPPGYQRASIRCIRCGSSIMMPT
ncbi:MAG: hypothetical protein WCS70_16310, partial [Verrucomicrobiota bacterium]